MEYLILSTALLIGDWGQTRYIKEAPDRHEQNIVMGKDPSLKQINIYFITVIAANASVGMFAPKRYREKWWYGLSVFQAGIFRENKRLSVGFNYSL